MNLVVLIFNYNADSSLAIQANIYLIVVM